MLEALFILGIDFCIALYIRIWYVVGVNVLEDREVKIDSECVRDILFAIEENSNIEHGCHMMGAYRKYPELEKYGGEAFIPCHVRYMEMKGMLFKPNKEFADSYDLTPAGHEFLANLREKSNRKKIQGISSSIGFASLKVVSAIAEGVAIAAVNQKLGLAHYVLSIHS